MDPYRELRDRLQGINPKMLTFTSGIVKEVKGTTCLVQIGADQWEARLRATELENDGSLLVVPREGSAVILACLAGDYSSMVVVAIDAAERIEMTGKVIINGGKNGGLVNIADLTKRLNDLVDDFNRHTHILPTGAVTVSGTATAQSNAQPLQVPAITSKHKMLRREDYEDVNVQH